MSVKKPLIIVDGKVRQAQNDDDVKADNYAYKQIITATDSLSYDDFIIGVLYTATGIVDLTLPLINGKKLYHIIDEGWGSTTKRIRLIPSGANKMLNNQDYLDLRRNGIAVSLYNDNNNNWYIF